MRVDEIKSDFYLVSFLSTNDKKLFSAHLKQMEKTVEVKKVSELITSDGMVIL